MLEIHTYGLSLDDERQLSTRLGQVRVVHIGQRAQVTVIKHSSPLLGYACRQAESAGIEVLLLDADGQLRHGAGVGARVLESESLALLLARVEPMAATEICGESLSERLRRALAARDGCVRLQGLGAGAGPVLLDFEEAVVWTPEAGIQGRDSCRDIASRFASLDMQPLISARPEGLHSQPLLQFLWLLGVYADTQGRLLAPLTEGAQVRLKNWPDFRLLARNPNDFRIAAALVRNAYDVPTLAAALQLSAHRVASFVNAAYLCNLVAPLQAVRPQPLVAHAARSATNNRLAGLWQRVRSGLLRAS